MPWSNYIYCSKNRKKFPHKTIQQQMSLLRINALSGWYETLFSHSQQNSSTWHVPPGLRVPIRALLQTTWSTRMKLNTKNTLLLSSSKELSHWNSYISQMLQFYDIINHLIVWMCAAYSSDVSVCAYLPFIPRESWSGHSFESEELMY